MSERKPIGPSALRAFTCNGPFGQPPLAWVFERNLDEGEWMRAPRTPDRLRVSAREAIVAVCRAWSDAAP